MGDFLELREGDLVVHATHGVGRYRGLTVLTRDGAAEECLCLEYRDGALLYVPASKIELVQKYVGAGDAAPPLDRIGGARWRKAKEAAGRAVLDLASELLELMAVRERARGIAYPPDDELMAEFESAFPYEETSDQREALAAIKADMESPRPMDRLVCGDVGYGKTELAMRAAFKAVVAGKQVAVLVPTTVLAQQHYETFSARMRYWPVRVELLSRFRTPAEQRAILADTRAGRVDILIGTHRLTSRDVAFRDLGLVIIDEEQRFGVRAKQFFKRLRATVDVLTLTATPIPRTLHLSLVHLKDISSLRTPPAGRLSIHTEVRPFEPEFVRQVILRELDRDGQVYFVHNRVRSIARVARKLAQLVPEARFAVVHGQMRPAEVEATMARFLRREVDVLVATTIIESGLDIPTVNTIFIHEAERFGLSELHQLRGRVGRYREQAFCYLMPSPRGLTEEARRRLRAVEEHAELGSGFALALKDLEIRGAGNILGAEQSGHIAAVGYEMYCRLLRQAVARLRDEVVREPADVELDLRVPAFVPSDYLTEPRAKLELLRLLGRPATAAECEAVLREVADRFGPPPPPVQALARLAVIRERAGALGAAALVRPREAEGLVVRFPTAGAAARARARLPGARPLRPEVLFLRPPGPLPAPEDYLGWVEEVLPSPTP